MVTQSQKLVQEASRIKHRINVIIHIKKRYL